MYVTDWTPTRNDGLRERRTPRQGSGVRRSRRGGSASADVKEPANNVTPDTVKRATRGITGRDFIAGITNAVTNIPDAMASAVLAGLNPIQGLYAIMVGTPVSALTTSSQLMTVAVTGAMALIVGDSLAPLAAAEKTRGAHRPDGPCRRRANRARTRTSRDAGAIRVQRCASGIPLRRGGEHRLVADLRPDRLLERSPRQGWQGHRHAPSSGADRPAVAGLGSGHHRNRHTRREDAGQGLLVPGSSCRRYPRCNSPQLGHPHRAVARRDPARTAEADDAQSVTGRRVDGAGHLNCAGRPYPERRRQQGHAERRWHLPGHEPRLHRPRCGQRGIRPVRRHAHRWIRLKHGTREAAGCDIAHRELHRRPDHRRRRTALLGSGRGDPACHPGGAAGHHRGSSHQARRHSRRCGRRASPLASSCSPPSSPC